MFEAPGAAGQAVNVVLKRFDLLMDLLLDRRSHRQFWRIDLELHFSLLITIIPIHSSCRALVASGRVISREIRSVNPSVCILWTQGPAALGNTLDHEGRERANPEECDESRVEFGTRENICARSSAVRPHRYFREPGSSARRFAKRSVNGNRRSGELIFELRQR